MSVLQLHDILLAGVPLLMSSTLLSTLHWYPWHNRVRELSRLTAYTVGTLVVVGVPVVTMLVAHSLSISKSELFWAMLLVANMIVSGVTVWLCYQIDESRAIGLDTLNEETTHGSHHR